MGVIAARGAVNSTRVPGLHVPDVGDRVVAPCWWDRKRLLRQTIPDPDAADSRENPTSSVSTGWYTGPAWRRHDGHGRGTTCMDLLLYIAMGVFAVLFAVVLYYLVIWAVGRASRPNRPVPPAGTTADRQPGDDQPRPNSTTGRKS